jgi:ABC-type multidrug transport system fused ATPase/permease subunit
VKALEQLTDSYDRKARLYPALLLIAPVVAVITAAVSAKYSALQAIVAGAVSCGGAFLLTQLARDAGKNLEAKLLPKWDGLPSVVIFRHRDKRFDSITKARYHRAMASLIKTAKSPTEEQEREEPHAADEIYTAWSNYLRTHTRDQKRFALLFKENINYGYRRNVLGLRPVGISFSIIACAIAVLRLWIVYRGTGQIDQAMLGAGAFSFVLFILWVFRFSPNWVRVPADAYAYRLIESIDSLGPAKATQKK